MSKDFRSGHLFSSLERPEKVVFCLLIASAFFNTHLTAVSSMIFFTFLYQKSHEIRYNSYELNMSLSA